MSAVTKVFHALIVIKNSVCGWDGNYDNKWPVI